MIDIAALTITALRADGLNAVDVLPEHSTRPVIRVEEAGGPGESSHMPDWAGIYDLQIDVWADTKRTARDTVMALWGVLRTHPANTHGQVTRARLTSTHWLPDPDWPTTNGRPSPRYVLVVELVAHP